MHPYKTRQKSKELRILSSLNARMGLLPKDKKHYDYQEKGYQGELLFDQLTSKLQDDLYILNDLCLEHNKSFFQIDTLIISQLMIYLFEVKNYEGDYRYESGNFYPRLSKEEIKNPLDQLKRCNSLLCPILRNLGFQLPIEGYVTFVNPNFTLYQAPINEPIIHPTQLNSLMKKLNDIPSRLSNRHKILADQLISMHQTDSPYSRFPSYTYNQLNKGIICSVCHTGFSVLEAKQKIVCPTCGHEETVDSAVLRSM
ncbi:nuclease-related domain-containing protein [Bacillus sp. ISL-18]|uniref:nuclease-related domain-containing protein n=1 Tax=Bacillus sp. ISL-18 TaxID=2819118 RepID=UPI0020353786|nr:nuclease-related domain-containing protein [Bacillus sp. ISL-18]